jgi:hypothetical protein
MERSLAVKINWMIAGKVYECEREKGACPFCGALDSVVELPEPLAAQQPDGTTHVCHPGLDGCNHGFAKSGHVPPKAARLLRRSSRASTRKPNRCPDGD